MKIFLNVLVILAALALIGAIILPQLMEWRPIEVDIGYRASIGSLPLFIAQEKGYFTDQNLEVKLTEYDRPEAGLNAMLSGEIATYFAAPWLDLLRKEQERGGRFRLYYATEYSSEKPPDALLVPNNSRIRRVADLRQKNIGYARGSMGRFYLQQIVDSLDFGRRRPNILEVSPPLEDALREGIVDAILAFEPARSVAVVRDSARTLAEGPVEEYLFDPLPDEVVVFTTPYLISEPKVFQKMKTAIDAALKDVTEDPDLTLRLAAELLAVNDTIIAEVRLPEFKFADDLDAQLLDRMIIKLTEHGFLIKEVTIDQLLKPIAQ